MKGRRGDRASSSRLRAPLFLADRDILSVLVRLQPGPPLHTRHGSLCPLGQSQPTKRLCSYLACPVAAPILTSMLVTKPSILYLLWPQILELNWTLSQSTTNLPANLLSKYMYTQDTCTGLEWPPKSTSTWRQPQKAPGCGDRAHPGLRRAAAVALEGHTCTLTPMPVLHTSAHNQP